MAAWLPRSKRRSEILAEVVPARGPTALAMLEPDHDLTGIQSEYHGVWVSTDVSDPRLW